MFDEDDGLGAMEAGLMYGFYRHGQDRQTAAIVSAIAALAPDPLMDDPGPDPNEPDDDDDDDEPLLNALDYVTANLPTSWDDYIGQAPLKRQLMIVVASAKVRGTRLPHILLASGYPGVGKTTVARLLAGVMECKIIELVPPFKVNAILAAAEVLDDGDIIFIDEIHKLADNGGRGAELLLKVLEDGVAFVDGHAIEFPDLTFIGATTDRDRLPEPVVERFKVTPYFQAYSRVELAQIAIKYADQLVGDPDWLPDDLGICIADASRQTPRVVERMVDAARDLDAALGKHATPAELLDYLEVESDGLTRTHVHYITAMRQYFARETKDGETEYIIGEAAIQQILRESKAGIGRIERFLIERGLIDRTPRGRRLTPAGIARAEEFIYAGKGAANVA